MSFSSKEYWYYENAKDGGYGARMSSISTLDEWLGQFGSDPRIRLIWLDVKVNVESQLKFFVDHLGPILL